MVMDVKDGRRLNLNKNYLQIKDKAAGKSSLQ